MNDSTGFAIFILALIALYDPEWVGSAAGKIVAAFNAEIATSNPPISDIPVLKEAR